MSLRSTGSIRKAVFENGIETRDLRKGIGTGRNVIGVGRNRWSDLRNVKRGKGRMIGDLRYGIRVFRNEIWDLRNGFGDLRNDI